MPDVLSVPVVDEEPIASVLRSLQLEMLEPGRFRAYSLPQVRRIYGGQVIGQALLAASATVEDEARLPHSLHAYFLRGGDPDAALDLSVRRLHDGRSFSSRHVACTQDNREILTLEASFQGIEGGVEFAPSAPDVPSPTNLTSALEIFRTMDHPVAKFLGKTAAFDVRHVQRNLYTGSDPLRSSTQELWMRPRHPLPVDMPQHLHRILLAYVVDQVMMEPALRATGLSWITPGMSLASLDHAMWFHRDVDINQWLLFSGRALSAGGGRATCAMSVYSQDGLCVASANQEGMVRVPEGERSGSGRWGLSG